MTDQTSAERFRGVVRQGVKDFRTNRTWIVTAFVELSIIGQIVFAMYAVQSTFGLRWRDFSLTDPHSFLRYVLAWHIVAALLAVPFFILLQVLFTWMRLRRRFEAE